MSARQHKGFVLVLTLWVLVVVAIAAGYFSERVSRAVELAQRSQQNTRAAIDMGNTRAELLYRLGTTTLTEDGLGRGPIALRLDNRAYHGAGGTLVQVQDTRGLLNLNFTDDDRLHRFLGLLGIEARQRGAMIDTLRDYIDADKFHRLNGAEEQDYLAKDMPPPANRELATPWEARRVMGWGDQPLLWQKNRLVDLTTTGSSLGINPNTAPAEVLATLPGATQEVVARILAQRKLAPFTHEGQITAITGMSLNLPMGMGVIVIPSDTLRITQFASATPWAEQIVVRLTPTNDVAPWRIDYYGRVSPPDPLPQNSVDMPARSIATPEKAPSFLFAK